ncbi:hypothetical protein KKB55_03895 [Myxococcota bacterium]|nr:hypothetical protein [Myxococcota bacterium]MBU1896892.1 hypothetical protein [Myxococcota bacterium]
MRSATLTLILFALALSGCDSDDDDDGPKQVPVTPTVATDSTTQNLEAALNALADRAELFSQSSLGEQANEAMAGGDDCATLSEDGQYDPYAEDCGEVADLRTSVNELREGIQDVIEFVRDRLLPEEAIEAQTDREIIYRLTPERLCDEGAAEPGEAPPAQNNGEAPYPPQYEDDYDYEDDYEDDGLSCQELLTQIPLRLRITAPAEGDVDVTLLVGEARLEPITLGIYRAGLSLTLNLGDVAASAQLVLDAEGEGEALPLQISGNLSASLMLNGETLTFGLNTTKIDLRVDDAEAPVRAGIDPSKLAVAMTPNGGGVDIAITYDIGALFFEAPLAMMVDAEMSCSYDMNGAERCDEPPAPEGNLRVEMAALKALVSVPANGDAINISDLQVGAGGIKVFANGATAMSFASILPRTLNITVGQEMMRLLAGGDLGLDMEIKDSVMARAMGEEADPSQDSEMHMHLKGAAPEVEVGEQLKVISGELRISGTGLDAELVAQAGMCVSGVEDEMSGPAQPERDPNEYPEGYEEGYEENYEEDYEEGGISLEGMEIVACE